VAEKGGGPFSWVVQAGWKRDGYLDCCGCLVWEPKYTMGPYFWIHSPGSGVTLLLRFGAVVYTIGWNVLGLQLVGVTFL
jgi:hypothetical protein